MLRDTRNRDRNPQVGLIGGSGESLPEFGRMNTVWIVEALRIFVVYALPGTVAIGTLVLFFRVLGQMKHLEARLTGSEVLKSDIAGLSRGLTNLKREMAEVPEEREKNDPGAGANAAMRAKALKMHRLG